MLLIKAYMADNSHMSKTIEDRLMQEITYGLSVADNFYGLEWPWRTATLTHHLFRFSTSLYRTNVKLDCLYCQRPNDSPGSVDVDCDLDCDFQLDDWFISWVNSLLTLEDRWLLFVWHRDFVYFVSSLVSFCSLRQCLVLVVDCSSVYSRT